MYILLLHVIFISFTFLSLVILYICCMAFISWPHIFVHSHLLVLILHRFLFVEFLIGHNFHFICIRFISLDISPNPQLNPSPICVVLSQRIEIPSVLEAERPFCRSRLMQDTRGVYPVVVKAAAWT